MKPSILRILPAFSLKTRLILTYALGISLSLLFLTFGINRLTEHLFSRFVSDAIDGRQKEILQVVRDLYNPLTSRFDTSTVETLGMYFAHEGYLVTVKDTQGEVIWDARSCDMEECNTVINEIKERMGQHTWIKGDFKKMSFPVSYLDKKIAAVDIETYGPLFFSQGESVFLFSLNRLFLAALMVFTGVSIVIAVLLATYILNVLDKRQRQLTADVAHELRTPLACLQGSVEAMIDGVWEPDPERLESCNEEIHRLAKLVSDLSLLTDIEWETIKLDKTDFDVANLLELCAGNFQGAASRKGLSLILDTETLIVHADYNRIKQVCIAIISNAIKYTDQGSVTIGNKGKEIFISDTGPGIDPESLPHIFDRFYRADTSRTRSTGGSGIGLTIAKALIRAQGGSIKVESEIGRGSTFKITF
jgi:signal transduction histidine kinase